MSPSSITRMDFTGMDGASQRLSATAYEADLSAGSIRTEEVHRLVSSADAVANASWTSLSFPSLRSRSRPDHSKGLVRQVRIISCHGPDLIVLGLFERPRGSDHALSRAGLIRAGHDCAKNLINGGLLGWRKMWLPRAAGLAEAKQKRVRHACLLS